MEKEYSLEKQVERRGYMKAESEITPVDLTGVYKEIAEVVGVPVALAMHSIYQGQQITFPKKLYTQSYILQQVERSENATNIRSIAVKYGYTERRLRQIIKESKMENQGGEVACQK